MSLLALLLPARARLSAGGGDAPAAAPGGWAYVYSADGDRVQREGSAPLAGLPRASATVAVAPAEAVSWHRITCPKAPAARLRAALAGLLEEQLLDETDEVHFALAPGAVPGQPAWVATCDRAWLAAQLAQAEQAGLPVDRVVPAAWPGEGEALHFHGDADLEAVDGPAWLTWSHADGVVSLPLAGALARSLLPSPWPETGRLSTTPAAASQAERWFGQPIPVVSIGEHLLQAARSPWNLRQFDLSPRHRGLAALRDGWRHFLQPAWRPVRLGLIGLALVQVVGLNAWAWQQRAQLRQKDADKAALVRQAFPQVQVVRTDVAVLQMQRELDQLRASAGVSGTRDLEVMLQAAASGWPAQAELKGLRFEPGTLQIESAPLTDDQLAAWRAALSPSGWRVDGSGGNYTISAGGDRAMSATFDGGLPPSAPRGEAGGALAALRTEAARRWQAMAPRERTGVTLALAVLGLYLLWLLALAPAWRTTREVPVRLAQADEELRQMRRLAEEAQALRALPAVRPEQSEAALRAATARLGNGATLGARQGERIGVTFKGVDAAALAAWLVEVRNAARARVVEVQLRRNGAAYDGSAALVLATSP